jgi:hypothetical protein
VEPWAPPTAEGPGEVKSIAATLAAVRAAGSERLSEDQFGIRLQAMLGFKASERERRKEWMLDPEVRGVLARRPPGKEPTFAR